MEERNPLQIPSNISLKPNIRTTNRSGRPTAKNEIKFSSQPKSIVAQMLQEYKTKDISVERSSNEIICLADQEDSAEESKGEKFDTKPCALRNSSMIEIEITSQDKQFSCDYPDCSYSCKLSSNLIKHKRVHTNEKPYLCDRCSFRSNFVNSLKTHKRIHTMDRPYQCEHCSYRCNTSSNLKKHCHHKHPTPKTSV